MDDKTLEMELRTARTLIASALEIQDASWIRNGNWGSPGDYSATVRDKAEKLAERLFQELVSRVQENKASHRIVSLASNGGILYASKSDGTFHFRTTDGRWEELSTP